LASSLLISNRFVIAFWHQHNMPSIVTVMAYEIPKLTKKLLWFIVLSLAPLFIEF